MLHRLCSSLAVSFLVGCALPAIAQDAPPPAAATAAVAPATPAPAPLTLEDCIQRALQHGFDLEIQRYSPAIAKDAVEVVRGGFIPTLSLTGSQYHANSGPNAGVLGQKSDSRSTRLGVTELLETGTTLNVSTNLNRSESTPAPLASLYNPAYTSDITIAVTQPLLRGAGTATVTAALNRARIGSQRASYTFRAQALDIIQKTEGAYYSLVFAREQLDVFRFSLDLAQKLLNEAQVKRATGVATDVDVLQAQVGVANARRNVIQAVQAVSDSSDALLALLGRFELDTPLGATKLADFTGQLPVIESSYQLALHNQPDYLSARLQLDQLKLDLAVATNALRPTLNLDGALGFNAQRGSGYDAFNGAANRDNNSWQVDFILSYPWGRVSDKARYRQSLATLNQQTLLLRQQEQTILVQVRSAVRAVETNSENVKIAGLAAEYSSRQYELERARFDAGLATSREVLQTQSDLENARVAELQARITLQNSISALHRIEGSSLERYHITLSE